MIQPIPPPSSGGLGVQDYFLLLCELLWELREDLGDLLIAFVTFSLMSFLSGFPGAPVFNYEIFITGLGRFFLTLGGAVSVPGSMSISLD
jgi:hypothetical protein